jgi:hypothetical protein
MTKDDLIAIEQYRRWLRPNWRLWLHPDCERGLTPEQIKAQRHDFMLRDRAFEPPITRRLRNEAEERAQIERARLEREHEEATERDVRNLRASHERLKAELAEINYELAWRRIIRKFRPDQPRVPAGNPDGGQWISGDGADSGRSDVGDSGAGRNEPRILSDATPDNVFKPGAQLAQDDTSRRSLVDLREEEARGGHTISAHVNRPPEALKAQVQEAFDREPRAQNVHSGSFSSVEAANKLVNSTLGKNRAMVDQVAAGLRTREVVFAEFESVTGIEAVGPNIRSEVYFRQTHNVGVVVQQDPYSPRGYFVLTAFPTSRRLP